MKLVLDNDFYVEGDLNSFVLYYESPSGKFNAKGEEIISREQWYYPSVKRCLEGYLEKAVGNMDTISIPDIIQKYNEILDKIGGYKEFVWNEKDTLAYSLMNENTELKKQLNNKQK
jgi:hypothetical protein